MDSIRHLRETILGQCSGGAAGTCIAVLSVGHVYLYSHGTIAMFPGRSLVAEG